MKVEYIYIWYVCVHPHSIWTLATSSFFPGFWFAFCVLVFLVFGFGLFLFFGCDNDWKLVCVRFYFFPWWKIAHTWLWKIWSVASTKFLQMQSPHLEFPESVRKWSLAAHCPDDFWIQQCLNASIRFSRFCHSFCHSSYYPSPMWTSFEMEPWLSPPPTV